MKHQLLFGLLAVSGVTFAQTTTPVAPKDPNAVVAVVGTEKITLADFEKEFKIYAGRALSSQGIPLDAESLDMLAPYREQILSDVVRQHAALQYAKKLGLKADDAAVKAQLDKAKGSFADEAKFQEALAANGFENEAQFNDYVANGSIYDQLYSKFSGRFTFNEATLKAVYEDKKESFYTAPSSCAKHILVKDEAAAKAAKARLDKGEKFEDVAKAVSEDPGSKDAGGDLGCLGQGETVESFDKAIFEGPLQQIQQVKTEYGVHLIWVDKRTEGGYKPLSEVQDQLKSYLGELATEKYIDSQTKKIPTEIHPELVKVEVKPEDTSAPKP